MTWIDATLNRPGWACRYTYAGGSLRSIRDSASVAGLVSGCWIARTESAASATPEAVLVAALMRKLQHRGTAPPIHPASERRLLERLGFRTVDPTLPGDMSPCLEDEVDTSMLGSAVLAGRETHELDGHVRAALDSDAERHFLTSSHGRWETPPPVGPCPRRHSGSSWTPKETVPT